MKVTELNREQLEELKQNYLTRKNEENGEGTSYGELADADRLVSDEEIFNEYADTEFTEDDFFSGHTSNTVVAYVAEMNEDEYLRINTTEDGDGTWFDFTKTIWDAYWMTNLDELKNIVSTEFSRFADGYPKFHKVRFDYQILETA